MGLFLKGNHFYEKFVCVSTPASFFYSMPISCRWVQTGICQVYWGFENEGEFQELLRPRKRILKYKGFQDACEPLFYST